MKIRLLFALLFIGMIAFSSAETVYYNTHNDKITSSYSIIYDDYDDFTRTIRITDRYDDLSDYYYYSRYNRDYYDDIYNRDYDWRDRDHRFGDYRRNTDLADGQDYYIYESPYQAKEKVIKCYDEAPKRQLFYTRCP